MASKKIVLVALLSYNFFHLVLLPGTSNAQQLKKCGFDAIYQLGDSYSDTGNLIRENPSSVYARLPYGETFFHKATGRCSDGLLVIDYLAISAGIPLLDAYLNPNGTFTRGHGANFAVAGSTALPVNVLAARNISSPLTNASLSTQLDWMFTHFSSICFNTEDCAEKLKAALFVVGEIGSNDYNYALLEKKTIEEAQLGAMVPVVVQAIKNAVREAIGYGARRVVVPGIFPMGCLPIHLTRFQTEDTDAYDESECLKELNNLSIHHNNKLKRAILLLEKEHPNVTIVYGDYYSAFQWVLRYASVLGFDPKSLQKACCGIGGEYNFNPTKMCGAPGVPVCPSPRRYVNWDGVQLTQNAYRRISTWLVRDISPKLRANCDF